MVLRSLTLGLGLILFGSCGGPQTSSSESQEPSNKTGKQLYMENCASCHGADGKLGSSGAKDLNESKMTDEQIEKIIHDGQGVMPPFKELIPSKEDRDKVLEHVKKFRD